MKTIHPEELVQWKANPMQNFKKNINNITISS